MGRYVAASKAAEGGENPLGSDYVLAFHTTLHGGGQPSVGRAAAVGNYRLWIWAGHDSGVQRVTFGGKHSADEASYLTLCAALYDVLDRILRRGRDPSILSAAILGGNQLVVRQLTGEYKVRPPTLQPLHAQARERLRGFSKPWLSGGPRPRSLVNFADRELVLPPHLPRTDRLRATICQEGTDSMDTGATLHVPCD